MTTPAVALVIYHCAGDRCDRPAEWKLCYSTGFWTICDRCAANLRRTMPTVEARLKPLAIRETYPPGWDFLTVTKTIEESTADHPAFTVKRRIGARLKGTGVKNVRA